MPAQLAQQHLPFTLSSLKCSVRQCHLHPSVVGKKVLDTATALLDVIVCCFFGVARIARFQFANSFFSLPLQSSYSQLLAATCLSKLVSRTSNPLPLEQRIDIREYALPFWGACKTMSVSSQCGKTKTKKELLLIND